MSTFTTITSTTTRQPVVAMSSEPVTGPTLLEAAYGGKVAFHKERSTGTLRRWPVLAPNTPERKKAESLRDKVAKVKGGVSTVAKSENVSVATLRRTLVALSFTEEIEGLTAKQRTEYAKAATANGKVEAPKAEPKPEQEAPKAEKKVAPKGKPASRSAAKATAKRVRRTAADTVAAGKAAGAAKAAQGK